MVAGTGFGRCSLRSAASALIRCSHGGPSARLIAVNSAGCAGRTSPRAGQLATTRVRCARSCRRSSGRRSIAAPLSHLLLRHAGPLLRGADLVVPVPLHWSRQWRRGFNQAHELASGLGLPVRGVLRRRRYTRSQTGLSADDRSANVREAFVLSRRAGSLDGLCVVVVDDVSTTGATLEACARVLKEGGVREVRTLTAARVATVPPPIRRH